MTVLRMRPDLPEAGKSRSYPVLPLLGAVAFPQGTVLLDLDHAASIHAFSCAMRADGLLLLANQRRAVDAPPFWVPIQHRPEDEQPSIDNLGKVGTLAKVIGASRLPKEPGYAFAGSNVSRLCDTPMRATTLALRRQY